jgi:glycerol uptake facilitator-like aquaporin
MSGIGRRHAASHGQCSVSVGLARRLIGEGLGSAFLLAAVVGSGILADQLFAHEGLALLANSLATGAALVMLIYTFGPISEAHFNPVVTLTEAVDAGVPRHIGAWYVVAQIVGAVLGVWSAHVMFGERIFMVSQHARTGAGLWFSEFIATFGLIAVITGCSRRRADAAPLAVAAYIMAAYWFTASTSFANPAVTLTRAFTDTFAGIRPIDAPGFIVAQVLGGLSAALLLRWLTPPLEVSQHSPLAASGSSAR